MFWAERERLSMKDTVCVTPFWNKLSISSHTRTGLQTLF